jgi:Core-2/I-Branching enzyme
MRIIYYLMSHKNERQIKRLVTHLRSGGNSFVLVHHDSKHAPPALRLSDDLWMLEDRVDVRWGGISVVHAMWKGLEWVQRANLAFDWMIFLSGQDYPIKPLSQIEEELRQTEFDAYVHHELIHENPALHQRYFHTLCMKRYFLRRLKIPGIAPLHFKRKHPYVAGINCFAGSQWLNLSHRAVEHLWARKAQAVALIRYLRNASCPDETVFQTLLINDSKLKVENSDKRYIVWRDDADSPEILGPEHLDMIFSSDHWFARKVDDTIYPELLDRLDDIVAASNRPSKYYETEYPSQAIPPRNK